MVKRPFWIGQGSVSSGDAMSSDINRFSLAKLPGSKWTASWPEQREKHFVVRNLFTAGQVELQAVLTGRIHRVDIRDLRDREYWIPGWK